MASSDTLRQYLDLAAAIGEPALMRHLASQPGMGAQPQAGRDVGNLGNFSSIADLIAAMNKATGVGTGQAPPGSISGPGTGPTYPHDTMPTFGGEQSNPSLPSQGPGQGVNLGLPPTDTRNPTNPSTGGPGGNHQLRNAIISMLLGGGFQLLGDFFGPNQNQNPNDPYTGPATNPEASLNNLLRVLSTAGSDAYQQAHSPVTLRSAYVPPPPAPLSIPGIPFKLGEGMGTDPAVKDPSLLTYQGLPDTTGHNPFTDILKATNSPAAEAAANKGVPTLRTPAQKKLSPK